MSKDMRNKIVMPLAGIADEEGYYYEFSPVWNICVTSEDGHIILEDTEGRAMATSAISVKDARNKYIDQVKEMYDNGYRDGIHRTEEEVV